MSANNIDFYVEDLSYKDIEKCKLLVQFLKDNYGREIMKKEVSTSGAAIDFAIHIIEKQKKEIEELKCEIREIKDSLGDFPSIIHHAIFNKE